MSLALRKIVLWFLLSAAVTSGGCVGLFFGGRILGWIVDRKPSPAAEWIAMEDLP